MDGHRALAALTWHVFVEKGSSFASPLPWHGAVCHLLSEQDAVSSLSFHAVHRNIFAPVWVLAGPFTICPLMPCIRPNSGHAADLLEPSRGLRAGTGPEATIARADVKQLVHAGDVPVFSAPVELRSAVWVRLRSLFERQGIAVVDVVVVEPELRAQLLREVGVSVAPPCVAWQKQALSARGFKQVGRRSENAI